jgi:hypothetical protein
MRPSFQLTPITEAVVAVSYHTGIPFQHLAELDEPILKHYFKLLEMEAEASKRR